jgi:hypothetical protein
VCEPEARPRDTRSLARALDAALLGKFEDMLATVDFK